MPKRKTNKSAAKRFKITKTGKVLKRAAGQGHFNSRESGKISMNKRRDVSLHKASVGMVKRQIPYN